MDASSGKITSQNDPAVVRQNAAAQAMTAAQNQAAEDAEAAANIAAREGTSTPVDIGVTTVAYDVPATAAPTSTVQTGGMAIQGVAMPAPSSESILSDTESLVGSAPSLLQSAGNVTGGVLGGLESAGSGVLSMIEGLF